MHGHDIHGSGGKLLLRRPHGDREANYQVFKRIRLNFPRHTEQESLDFIAFRLILNKLGHRSSNLILSCTFRSPYSLDQGLNISDRPSYPLPDAWHTARTLGDLSEGLNKPPSS